MVQSVCADLSLETATLDEHQTLEFVLCRDFVCFRPLRVEASTVDILAALEGQTRAQQAFREWLRSALQGML
jgi:hypothetical protein